MSRTGSGQTKAMSLRLAASPMGMAGTQTLDPFFTAFPGTLARSYNGSQAPGTRPRAAVWDAGLTRGSLTHCASTLTLTHCLHVFGYISKSRIAGSFDSSLLSFLRNPFAIFHISCISLYCRFPLLHILPSTGYHSSLW